MPLFISRRLQDYVEHSYQKLFLIFLDWENAFDKVDQTLLVRAMERLNIPEKIIRILESFYVDPKFRIHLIENRMLESDRDAHFRLTFSYAL